MVQKAQILYNYLIEPDSLVRNIVSESEFFFSYPHYSISPDHFSRIKSFLSKECFDVYGDRNLEGLRIYKVPDFKDSVITVEFNPRKERIQIGSSSMKESLSLQRLLMETKLLIR